MLLDDIKGHEHMRYLTASILPRQCHIYPSAVAASQVF